ncbi:hypothetical protein BLNAU_24054 [Blattamonas nauphoetae]|uniref:Uncharacterized protein n=1 Tax=Blattamonas nauphoetae TaxID=2049346 RepID=A0ABQ9WNG6_9EUKA|nr:hypothetical protein BLNAU_24054 [Blattamonas nauphoetae]
MAKLGRQAIQDALAARRGLSGSIVIDGGKFCLGQRSNPLKHGIVAFVADNALALQNGLVFTILQNLADSPTRWKEIGDVVIDCLFYDSSAIQLHH